ncbi:MAG: arsenate reductase/protein-tyrosine-phosphatase family protein [Phycisphaerales bacterium]
MPPRPNDLTIAIRALNKGGLVLGPTETIFGVFVRASHAPDARAARARLRPDSTGPLTVHLPDEAALRSALSPLGRLAPLQERIVGRLIPGPVTLRIERTPETILKIEGQMGIDTGSISDGDGGALLVRVPDHPAAARLLGGAEGPTVGIGVASALGEVAPRTLAEAQAKVIDVGIATDATFDGLPAPAGVRSTVVRLTSVGGYAVEPGGMLSETKIADRLARRVLFVCTGNTCRSPMAEAIARGLAEGLVLKIPTRFASAGIAGHDGAPFSPEAHRAVERLGIGTLRGSSRALTAAEIAGADLVFALTRAHERAARSLSPAHGSKVRLLDPAGGDVSDPIGGPQALYDQTARALRTMIAERLAELEASDG